MAQKRRFLDVWIVESDTVYREVPYSVVVDWIQQGRLLENDMLRWSGQAEWFRLGATAGFAAYMPRAEAFQANDRAEALEPVQVGFRWKRRPEEDEGDVDMIPLIDVSLVLIIFFMMTTTTISAAFFINTPGADTGLVTSDPDLVWVGIDFQRDRQGQAGDRHQLVYSMGQGDKLEWNQPAADTDAGRRQALDEIARRVQEFPGAVEVTIKADTDIPEGLVRDLAVRLEALRAKVTRKYIGVSDKVNP